MEGHVMSTQERQLCEFLGDLPFRHKNRYGDSASNALLYSLFWSMAGGEKEYMHMLFPEDKEPVPHAKAILSEAQGAQDGAEYTEGARGKPCGHIFKSGEATYRCKTCSTDDTCVLCSKCYASSDHTNHVIMISISPGNSGCCDCGDPEAWRIPVNCTIHTDHEDAENAKGKQKENKTAIPQELAASIRMTISRALDYLCDVISCSPEHLRQAKEVSTVMADERNSRLKSAYYPTEAIEQPVEYAVILWNDEKHTVQEVRDQVARACKVKKADAEQRAYETDDVGRSIVKYGTDLEHLLQVAAIIEQIKVTVSVRSARDTFREQMCGTIIEWLSDISGCSVGDDHDILRRIVCEEMLSSWRMGSEAVNAEVGKAGIDDQAKTEYEMDPEQMLFRRNAQYIRRQRERAIRARTELLRRQAAGEDLASPIEDEDSDSDVDEDPEQAQDSDEMQEILDVILVNMNGQEDGEDEMDVDNNDLILEFDDNERSPMEIGEAAEAGFPPPPPPPPPRPIRVMPDGEVRTDSPTASEMELYDFSNHPTANMNIPKTPGKRAQRLQAFEKKAPKYWKEVPEDFLHLNGEPPEHENIHHRVRLDYLILFDLRLWKQARIDLRDLYISTVVTIPEFKRILGLRFSGLYTLLSQLYLIADREPDHSIISISVQMLTTPSITAEVVEKGNFFTHLLSILFTFLTTRQVSPPYMINPNATLKIETGSVTNRRMYHFFHDLKYLFASPHMQQRMRTEPRYLLQFLDLVKIHQGICPNVRAVGEHVEYETDAWISASLVTREINRLCRQFSESWVYRMHDDLEPLACAIRVTAKAVIINSLGMERKRFESSEIQDELKFKSDDGDYEFDIHNTSAKKDHKIVKFDLTKGPVSFHHALHYTLSWLIECGRTMSSKELARILKFEDQEDLLSQPRMMGHRILPSSKYDWEDYLMAAFDYPLRVCAWLAQMKAGLWVRNGMSLRHQASTYRSVSQRDVAYHRDVFLLQTAMVLVSPDRMLATMIDRYGLSYWMKGIYEQNARVLDHSQQLDVAEEMIHLLVILLCERTSLITIEDEPHPHAAAMRRDIIHCLCFKPLSYTEICSKLGDKFEDYDECADILEEMTDFKPPVGVNDVGTFKLKEEYLADLDPYIAHYNKNQREEAETIARKWMATQTGRPAADVVFEPKLRAIESGIFTDLAAFTNTGMFAQIIYYSLLYPIKAKDLTPTVQPTKVEAFLHVVLHLVLIAITHDKTLEADSKEVSSHSFVHIALTKSARSNFIADAPHAKSIVAVLNLMSTNVAFESCQPKVRLILKRLRQKRQQTFDVAFARLGASIDRLATASPAIGNPDEERSRKRKAAMDRQAKIKADFQERQKNFLSAQADIDWGVEELDEDMDEVDETKKLWKYPSGNCLYCQEETNESRPYGTFGMIGESHILRQTDFNDKDFVREAAAVPLDLDRSAESIRPFGVSGENKKIVQKINAEGYNVLNEESFVGKGFPSSMTKAGPVSTGCGHLMHYSCFDVYYQATHRTQRSQVARHHAERLDLNEFICPLCKAQGNAFLPIIWHDVEEQYPGVIEPRTPIEGWLEGPAEEAMNKFQEQCPTYQASAAWTKQFFDKYLETRLVGPLLNELGTLDDAKWDEVIASSNATYDPTIDLHLLAGGPQGAQQLIEIIATDRASVPVNNDSSIVQLAKIMLRLDSTLVRNGFERHLGDPNVVKTYGQIGKDILAQTLGLSIAAVEIQHRGVETDGGSTFLSKVPELSLTHLRILCETTATSMALKARNLDGLSNATVEVMCLCTNQMWQLFCRKLSEGQILADQPFLGRDSFSWLAESTFYLVPFLDLDIMHVARLCYTAEIFKVILMIVLHTSSSRLSSWYADEVESGANDTSFQRAMMFVMKATHDKASLADDMTPGAFKTDPITCGMDQDQFANFDSAKSLVQRYALVFIRKLTLLLHVQYGVDFANLFPTGANELERLTHALKLPTVSQICDTIGQNLPAIPSAGFSLADEVALGLPVSSLSQTQVLIFKWAALQRAWAADPKPDGTLWAERQLSVSHPVIFELVGLPKNYDTLVEASVRAKCPTTGKDVSDPNLCLFCAAIVCGQATCCLKQEERFPGLPAAQIGGAQQHMRVCNNPLGLFLNIRKCNTFYLHRKSGSWGSAPYTDRYGETDQGLRHGRQLFLNTKRYDALLRNVWLAHGVPSVISRKLETDVNNGGWETI